MQHEICKIYVNYLQCINWQSRNIGIIMAYKMFIPMFFGQGVQIHNHWLHSKRCSMGNMYIYVNLLWINYQSENHETIMSCEVSIIMFSWSRTSNIELLTWLSKAFYVKYACFMIYLVHFWVLVDSLHGLWVTTYISSLCIHAKIPFKNVPLNYFDTQTPRKTTR